MPAVETFKNVPELFELFGIHKFPIETAKVEFELKEGPKGLNAINVKLI